MLKGLVGKLFRTTSVQRECFEKTSHLFENPEEFAWGTSTTYKALNASTTIHVLNEAGMEGQNSSIIQTESKVTFENNEIAVTRRDNSCWQSTTIHLRTKTEVFDHKLSAETPDKQCQEILWLFSNTWANKVSSPLAAKVLCATQPAEVEAVLRENSQTIVTKL